MMMMRESGAHVTFLAVSDEMNGVFETHRNDDMKAAHADGEGSRC